MKKLLLILMLLSTVAFTRTIVEPDAITIYSAKSDGGAILDKKEAIFVFPNKPYNQIGIYNSNDEFIMFVQMISILKQGWYFATVTGHDDIIDLMKEHDSLIIKSYNADKEQITFILDVSNFTNDFNQLK